MSNNVTPTATESGEIQAVKENQVMATIGNYKDQMIDASDAIIVFGVDSVQHTIHRNDDGYYETIDGVNYLNSALVYCDCGSYRGKNIPLIASIQLYSGSFIHINDRDMVVETHGTSRKFIMEQIESERIVLLYEGEEAEMMELYEYSSKCTKIYTASGYFWTLDCETDGYYYLCENGCRYKDEAALQACGFVYDEREDEWISQRTYNDRYNEDGFDNHHNTKSYHYFTRRSRMDDKHCGYSIGFEVEKEDREKKVKISAHDLYNDLGWCKETDGSLDEKSGFEAVSPIYSLFGKQLDIDIKNSDLREILNADYNAERCGGHINISSDQFTKEQLYEGISAFFPLLYCIYESRINESYCRAKKKNKMSADSDKYSAIYIRENRVEIRIFPAVKSVENLIWRRDLVRIMIKNINATELQVFKMMMNKKSKLYRHLNKVMSEEKIHEKCVKFLEFSKAFNDKNIDGHGNNLLNK